MECKRGQYDVNIKRADDKKGLYDVEMKRWRQKGTL